MSLFHIIRNWLDFPVRSQVRWSRKGLHFDNEPKHRLFQSLPESRRSEALSLESRLRRDYHLTTYYHSSKADHYQEAVYYLHMLETALNAASLDLPDSVHSVDIGVSHWFYIQTLYALLLWWNSDEPRSVEIEGYEMDAFRLYSDLYSRFDHAIAHINNLPNIRYIPSEYTPENKPCQLAFLLFPFLTRRAHLRWGLPVKSFQPENLLRTAYSSLEQGGLLVIANQGSEEMNILQDMLHSIGLQPIDSFRFDSPLLDYKQDRYITILQQ